MKIKYTEYNGKCYIQAFNNEEMWLSTVILDTNCDEYPRYKEYNPLESDNVLMEYLGLEPDYLFDILNV